MILGPSSVIDFVDWLRSGCEARPFFAGSFLLRAFGVSCVPHVYFSVLFLMTLFTY